MRRLTLTAVVILILHSLTTNVEANFEKIKIAVLDFKTQGNDFGTKDIGKIVAEWLITAFVNEGRFEVIERRLLEQILEEQQMSQSGLVDQDTASAIGKLLGVKVIISGSVSKLQNFMEVNARIVDVETGSIITAESVSSHQVDALGTLVRDMAKKIIRNFPLEGYIAHREDSAVVIDLGRKSGVKEGMIFEVYKEGEIVKHPKTGEILYVKKIDSGTVKITSVQDKIAKGIILEEIGETGIQYGDQIKSQATVTGSNNSSGTISSTTGHQGRLFVTTTPSSAVVRILNIKPKYNPGMSLEVQPYHIEVSCPGFNTHTQWYSLKAGDNALNVDLTRTNMEAKNTAPDSSPAVKSKHKEYYTMLLSKDSSQVRYGAKYLYRKFKRDREVINMAHYVLEKRYMENPNDRAFVDGMAWLCNILGASGQSSHRALLSKVSQTSSNKKLCGYAEKNLKKL